MASKVTRFVAAGDRNGASYPSLEEAVRVELAIILGGDANSESAMAMAARAIERRDEFCKALKQLPMLESPLKPVEPRHATA
jgi:hypothetical protein